MKILITTGLYPPEIGGPATYSKILHDELPKRGITVFILPFSAVRKFPRIIRHTAYFWKTLCAGIGSDVIYAQDPVSVGLPALCAAKLLRKRFLLRVGGDYAWEQFLQSAAFKSQSEHFINPEDFQKLHFGFATEMRRKVQRFVARHAERVIVPSEYLKKIVILWGVPSERIALIYNAYEPKEETLSKEKVRETLGLRGHIILSAGRLVPWKGFAMLIAMMPYVREHFADTVLLIAGDGPEHDTLEMLAKKHRVSSYVRLLGALPQKKLTEYIKAADVFVLNTGYEGFSHQLVEVMALRTPVVTTNIGGNSELIKHNVSGALVEYDNMEEMLAAILKLLEGENVHELTERAYEVAHAFTVQKMVEETEAILS